MYEKGTVLPTLKNIHSVVNDSIAFKGSVSFLRKILKELGFSYRRCNTNRKVLMEKSDITLQRVKYLRQIKKPREEGHPIIYTDETYVHGNHSVPKCWQTKDMGLKIPFSKGERMVVLHAGSEAGFIPGAALVFKAKTTSGDYHSEMNADNFTRWLREMLIPNLPENSVLVLDNAAYHNVQVDRCPTMSSTKAVMQDCLRRHGVEFDLGMLKAELLELFKLHKPKPSFVVDEILKQHGHQALRLPPYHADLNPIELVWANLKGYIGRRNLKFKLTDVKALITEGLSVICPKEWDACCEHVRAIEDNYCKSDVAVDHIVDSFVINLDSDSDVSSGSETDTASECGETTDTADEG